MNFENIFTELRKAFKNYENGLIEKIIFILFSAENMKVYENYLSQA